MKSRFLASHSTLSSPLLRFGLVRKDVTTIYSRYIQKDDLANFRALARGGTARVVVGAGRARALNRRVRDVRALCGTRTRTQRSRQRAQPS